MDGFYPSVYFDNRPTPPGAQSRALTPEKAAFNLQLKEDIQRVDHVIYQSQWVKTLADQYLAPRTKAFSVVYNGVNMDTFKPLPQKRKKMHLLTAGHIRHEYMLNTILPIFLKLKKEFSLGLIVAGPMDVINRQTFEQARNQHPREFEDVIYLGPISHARLPSVYQQGDVFIHPRAGDGCPNVVVEALASGLPVVCPKWGGTAELIGKGGIAVEAGAWDYSQAFIDGMTNATYKVLQNLDPFKKEARLQAVTHLDEKTMGRKYQEILFA
jgi:glycosyltransferase involved in cell wall biosynthesis